MATSWQQQLQHAAEAYGTDLGLLKYINQKEQSGSDRFVVNDWDSNAKRGTPSGGPFQFIQPTFDAYARSAKEANPEAWRNVSLDWRNPQAQALAASWAFANGKGSAWSTYPKNGIPPISSIPSANKNSVKALTNPRASFLAGIKKPSTTPIKMPAKSEPGDLFNIRRAWSKRGHENIGNSIANRIATERGIAEQQERQRQQDVIDYQNKLIVAENMRKQDAMDAEARGRYGFAGTGSQQNANYSNGAGSNRFSYIPNTDLPGSIKLFNGEIVANRRAGETTGAFLQRLGQASGLYNDAGNSQTTGGQHTTNSQHYTGDAVDFGDAKNDRSLLNKWYAWLNARKDILGISELLDEGDHIHVGGRGMEPKPIPTKNVPKKTVKKNNVKKIIRNIKLL